MANEIDDDVELNPDAVNAPFPTRDQVLYLIAQQKAVLDIMGADPKSGWMEDANHSLRQAYSAQAIEKREIGTRLKAASHKLRADFSMGED